MSSSIDRRARYDLAHFGEAIGDALFAAGWVRRAANSRALRVTARGLEGLDALGVRHDAWA